MKLFLFTLLASLDFNPYLNDISLGFKIDFVVTKYPLESLVDLILTTLSTFSEILSSSTFPSSSSVKIALTNFILLVSKSPL